jgi:hypothetical protein
LIKVHHLLLHESMSVFCGAVKLLLLRICQANPCRKEQPISILASSMNLLLAPTKLLLFRLLLDATHSCFWVLRGRCWWPNDSKSAGGFRVSIQPSLVVMAHVIYCGCGGVDWFGARCRGMLETIDSNCVGASEASGRGGGLGGSYLLLLLSIYL